ncbi:hypothetical protein V5799_018168 [Amblyomma americanum]|uniref:Uncharacterized protein n=1 Tax=Amblyomma americanum TaxID=6943 RepID=A0AAQ4F0L4_AMBAM
MGFDATTCEEPAEVLSDGSSGSDRVCEMTHVRKANGGVNTVAAVVMEAPAYDEISEALPDRFGRPDTKLDTAMQAESVNGFMKDEQAEIDACDEISEMFSSFVSEQNYLRHSTTQAENDTHQDASSRWDTFCEATIQNGVVNGTAGFVTSQAVKAKACDVATQIGCQKEFSVATAVGLETPKVRFDR